MGILGAPFGELTAGERFETSERAITEAEVAAFANLSGDFHPAHMDTAWAANGPFGMRIAHGLLVVVCAAELLVLECDYLEDIWVRGAVFKSPVPLGSRIRMLGRVASLEPSEERFGKVTLATRIVSRGGSTLIRASLEALWRRAPNGPERGRPASLPDPRRAG